MSWQIQPGATTLPASGLGSSEPPSPPILGHEISPDCGAWSLHRPAPLSQPHMTGALVESSGKPLVLVEVTLVAASCRFHRQQERGIMQSAIEDQSH
jgi:hypothetical protein